MKVFYAVFYILISSYLTPLLAQESADTEHPLQQKYHHIFSALEESERDALAISTKIKSAEGEDKTSLQLRHFDYAVSTLNHLNALTLNLQEQKKSGLNIDATIARIRTKMLTYGPKIRQALIHKEQQFSDYKRDNNQASTNYILSLSKHLNYIDTALIGLFDHTQNLKILGLDNTQSQKFLNAELQRRAELLTGQLQLLDHKKQALKEKLTNNETDTATKESLLYADEKTTLITSSLRKVTKMMSDLGIDSSDYKSMMIQSTGHISTDILDWAVLQKLVKEQASLFKAALSTDGIEVAFRLVLFIMVMLLFWFLSYLIGIILKLGFKCKPNTSHLMRVMITALICRSIIIIGFLVALSQIGVSLLPLLTGLGIAGFIIGFALQDTLSNFASGMMILLYRPYDVGDMVRTGGVSGRVDSMNLVSTTIMTIDNQTLIIPNTKIWGDIITNLTNQKIRRIDMVFNLPLESDIDESLIFFKQIIENTEAALSTPEPTIELGAIHNHALEFIVRPWVITADYWPTYWGLNAEVKRQLDAKSIALPVQQHHVTIQPEKTT